MMKAFAMPQLKPQYVPFAGGLDLVTPNLKLKPGVAREMLNFECAVAGGYARVAGYERFDGKAKPADSTYSLIQFDPMVTIPSVGQTLTGNTTGTTGVIIAATDTYVAVTLIVGAGYSITETMNVGATLIGTATEVTVSISSALNAEYLHRAANVYRALITAVPGSGPIRGVFSMLNNGIHEVFAFRNNVGGTSCDLYKASTSGWTQVPYLYEISFTSGAVAVPADGATLTQGGVTAIVKRVCLESSDWTGSGAGRFVIAAPSGGNFAAGAATLTGGATCTLSGVQTAITMLPGGTFEFDENNFSGQQGTVRIYGCDRVNRCFEFDGVTLAPIKTGLSTDAPTYIVVHQKHLFVMLKGSMMNSGLGTPFMWTALSGAAEYGLGKTGTGMKVLPGAQNTPTLFVGTISGIQILYGSSKADFQLVNFNTSAGPSPRSIQNLERSYMLTTMGVTDLTRAQEFGNFQPSTLTFPIQTLIDEKRSLIVSSCIHQSKSQYRVFFSDGSGVSLTIVNGKMIGCGQYNYPNPIQCAWNGTLPNGNPVIYAGSTNGMVYQLERGSSFDGAAIDFSLTPNWNAMDAPRIMKDYFKASLEIQGSSYAAIDVAWLLGYGSNEYEPLPAVSYEANLRGEARWDSATWDAFIWDGAITGPMEIDLAGTAENIQMKLSGSSAIMYPFTLPSITFHYIPRRMVR